MKWCIFSSCLIILLLRNDQLSTNDWISQSTTKHIYPFAGMLEQSKTFFFLSFVTQSFVTFYKCVQVTVFHKAPQNTFILLMKCYCTQKPFFVRFCGKVLYNGWLHEAQLQMKNVRVVFRLTHKKKEEEKEIYTFHFLIAASCCYFHLHKQTLLSVFWWV